MTRSRLIFIAGLILTALVSRLIPHLPNFTALSAIALFSGFYFTNSLVAFCVPLTAAFISDCLLGFYPGFPFVYLSYGLIISLGTFVRPSTLLTKALTTATASLLFFFVTNFGVWYSTGLYSNSLSGLAACYIAGLPFLFNQFLGDLTYVCLISFTVLATEKNLKANTFELS